MFERFTRAARRVVVEAQTEARGLHHNYIGTEHVLLGLLADSDSTAARALARVGVTSPQAREQVETLIGRGEQEPSGHIPFTPRAKKVLELSLREALHLKVNYIGTEHILLGLLREGEGVGAQVLVALGAAPERVRREVERLVAERPEPEPETAPSPRRAHTPAAAAALAAAEQLAGGSPIGSHHLLEALARSHRSAAAHALAAAGVDVEVLTTKLDEQELAGTTDLTPEEEAARKMEIRLAGDEVQVVLRDEATRELVRTAVDQVGGPLRGDDPVAGGLVPVHQAVNRYLLRLQRRLSPEEPPEPGSGSGITALVRHAMRARLRRRGR
jgi:ATP-dependent Clp protease ATP-binding subunit ClpC